VAAQWRLVVIGRNQNMNAFGANVQFPCHIMQHIARQTIVAGGEKPEEEPARATGAKLYAIPSSTPSMVIQVTDGEP